VDVCLGVDVGTGSVRAGLFDLTGRCLGVGVEAIELYRPAEDFVEQSSDDIWRAAGVAVRQALGRADLGPDHVVGIGFDATSCSLVALDARDRPVSVSPTGNDAQNVVVWMDHRATREADRINATGHPVLQYVGRQISPEMQTPKLLWLFEQLPRSWERTRHFFDLPDFLVHRATGMDARSSCSTTCKGTYLAHEGRWDAEFFRRIGLGGLADDGFVRIGTRIQSIGERAGTLTSQAANELGLVAGVPVAVSIIDAHAGGLGSLGFTEHAESLTAQVLEERLALIAGTSSCHMVVSREPRFVRGVWGPYYSAMVPGLWLNEGGQSATGALLDHVVLSHVRGAELLRQAAAERSHVHALLNARIQQLARSVPFPAALTRGFHVYPDFYGNRSPLADPSLRGMISGLGLSDSVDALALSYLATVQAVAHGTRHILDVMNAHGHRVRTLVATGGDAKNPVFLREHADATGCRIVLPREPEAVLLGSAMLGAVASGRQASVMCAMQAMSGVSRIVEPAGGEVAAYHALKHEVFQRMARDQLEYRRLMTEGGCDGTTKTCVDHAERTDP
jgi:FGGY-family pentulose kinase